MIEEIAFLAKTAPSSVTKFCKKLGYPSFKEMRNDLAAYAAPDFFSFKESVTPNMIDAQQLVNLFLDQDAVIQKNTFDKFDKELFSRIAQKMSSANAIACISNTYAFPISNFLRELMAPLGIPVLAINRRSEPETIRQIITSADVVFYISLTGKAALDYQLALESFDSLTTYQVLVTKKPPTSTLTIFQEVISFDNCEPFFESNYYSQRIMMNAILYLSFLMKSVN